MPLKKQNHNNGYWKTHRTSCGVKIHRNQRDSNKDRGRTVTKLAERKYAILFLATDMLIGGGEMKAGSLHG